MGEKIEKALVSVMILLAGVFITVGFISGSNPVGIDSGDIVTVAVVGTVATEAPTATEPAATEPEYEYHEYEPEYQTAVYLPTDEAVTTAAPVTTRRPATTRRTTTTARRTTAPPTTVFEGMVNINTASQQELESLPGIGPARAERIIEFRQQQRFRTTQDIMHVSGIGQGIFRNIMDRITVE